MYILKNLRIIIAIMAAITACTPLGPLTAEKAFYKVKKAYLTDNVADFRNTLSKGSIEKIKNSIKVINSMTTGQREIFCNSLSLKKSACNNLNIDKYILIQFLTSKKDKNHFLYNCFSQDMLVIKKDDKKARVYLKDGRFLNFVKELNYWKLEISQF